MVRTVVQTATLLPMSKDEVHALETALIAQIRAEIAAAGTTQGNVADAVGIERATLSRYMSGKRALPLQTFLDISDTLGIPAAELMTLAEDRARRHTKDGSQ